MYVGTFTRNFATMDNLISTRDGIFNLDSAGIIYRGGVKHAQREGGEKGTRENEKCERSLNSSGNERRAASFIFREIIFHTRLVPTKSDNVRGR